MNTNGAQFLLQINMITPLNPNTRTTQAKTTATNEVAAALPDV